MDAYLIKRRVLRPYFSLMRRLFGTETFGARAGDLHNWGPAVLKFSVRYLLNPTVLTRAPMGDVKVIVDVGGYDGQWAAAVLRAHPEASVYVFEPDPGPRLQAGRRFGDDPRVRLFPYGLAAKGGAVAFSQCGMGSTAYAEGLHRAEVGAAANHEIRVFMRAAKTVFDELGLTEIDFMKVNIEGGEYDLLEHLLESGCLARCRCLLVQFHEWIPDAYARRRRLRAGLTRTHRCDWSDYFVWERWTRR